MGSTAHESITRVNLIARRPLWVFHFFGTSDKPPLQSQLGLHSHVVTESDTYQTC